MDTSRLKQTTVDHLCALIRIPSVSLQSNRPIIEYAKRVLAQAQWHSKEFIYRDAFGVEKVNLIAAPIGQDLDNKEVALAIVCHTDTVPHAPAWENALLPHEADGHVFGCGACDVKGFLACMLTAAEMLSSSSIRESLRFVLTADEEIGCVGAGHLLNEGFLKPRTLVVGEPTSLHPARAGKGYALAEFIVHGQEAHSALPASGVSAIYGAARLIAAIEGYAVELESDRNLLFSPPCTTINIGVVEGGTAKNIIPGSCRFLLEWRAIPNQNLGKVFFAVKALADAIAANDDTFKYSATLLRQQLGFETMAESKLIHKITASTRKPPTSIAFGSEASILANLAEEVVVFGPGDMQTAHSDRECVPIAELISAVDCLRVLMTDPN